MIKAEGLTKKFDEHLAVDRLDLDIPQGEVFGFLGPNGAGKTTTVRMLCSLIVPTGGTAVVAGHRVGEADQGIRRNVGILTETPGMYDRLTAWRNLTIYAKLYEVDDVEGRVTKYLKLLGLWERRNDAVGTFSKGMRQKLAIARALLHEPSVVFLDEPTSGLDPEAAKLVRDFIADMKDQGRTIFMCTHNLQEAEDLCDRVAVFKTHLRVVDSPTNLQQGASGRKVVFHLGHSGSDLVAGVEALPMVQRVEAQENKLVVAVADPEQDNPDIIRHLVGVGAAIQFVGEMRHSLEDVYLQLMQREG